MEKLDTLVQNFKQTLDVSLLVQGQALPDGPHIFIVYESSPFSLFTIYQIINALSDNELNIFIPHQETRLEAEGLLRKDNDENSEIINRIIHDQFTGNNDWIFYINDNTVRYAFSIIIRSQLVALPYLFTR